VTKEDGPEAVVDFLEADGIVAQGVAAKGELVPQAKPP
jgi:hypothetical protein